jgi:TRAP-type C4-dicarboxylate transport system substrate-binding protein
MKSHLAHGVAVGAICLGATQLSAETFQLTVVAGHPPITKGVAAVRDYFIPEIDRRLAEAGGEHSIEWTEAYAGAVADVNGVLEAVESGIADFGYVPHLFEADNVPLEQITYLTPFGTSDLPLLMEVISELHAAVPEIGEGWARHNQMVLAPVGIDTYHFVTNFPIESISDLEGRRIGTAGLALNWLNGSGAIPVSGALPSFYNSISTGLIDGVMTFESAVAPYDFYEVAPYITRINFGAMYASALTVNLDTWERLPEEVRAIILEVAEEYRDQTAVDYYEGGQASLNVALDNGGTISDLPDDVRAAYASQMPNVARDWAEELDARGLPGTEVLETYMRLAEERGITFARDWAAE